MPTSSKAQLHGLDAPKAWDTDTAFAHLKALGLCDTKRTAERRLQELSILPNALSPDTLRDEQGRAPNRVLLDWLLNEARGKRRLVLFAQLHTLPTGTSCLVAQDARGANFWVPLASSITSAASTANSVALKIKSESVQIAAPKINRLRQVRAMQSWVRAPLLHARILKTRYESCKRTWQNPSRYFRRAT